MYAHPYLAVLVLALCAGCAGAPRENTALSDARSLYQEARSDPETARLAAVELRDAGVALERANAAATRGERDEVIAQRAYLVRQRVAIAQETARRKTAEQAMSQASDERERIRLEARTREVEAARRLAAEARVSAQAQAERDQALLAARERELEAARQAAEQGRMAAEQQAQALAEMKASTESTQALIAAKEAEAEAAREQAAAAQQAAEQQAAALAAARAEAEQARSALAEQEILLKELNAKQTQRGLLVTLGDVLFGVGKDQLTAGGMRNVQKLASYLQQYPDRQVMVEGHTDSTGSDSFNQALSERRAEAVKRALVGMGVAAERIATRGYGKAFPVASNATAAGRQHNRRVDIVVSDSNEAVAPLSP